MSTLATAAVKLATTPRLVRAVARPLVRFRPIIATRSRVLVLRHVDVCDVLARDEEFTVAEVNATPMLRVNGPFILGMDRSAQYERERSILQLCVHPGDEVRIRTEVRATAARLVGAARPTGRIDVVRELARPAALELVASYLGVPGPDEATMARWMRALFHETFLNLGDDAAVRRAAVAAGDALHAHVDDLIERRHRDLEAGRVVPDDFLTRLVHLQDDPATRLSDEGIRRNLGGVVVGAVETTSQATAQAVDQLLRRPRALHAASRAARAGDLDEVARHAFEALRFHPIAPALRRHASRPAVLAAGTRWERTVRAGSEVYAGVLPAMFDPAAFRHPAHFDASRPAAPLLHFGAGLHTCFGRYVNLVQIPELVAALLRLDGLRVPRRPSRITFDGPFPDRFEVVFDPVADRAEVGR